CASSSGINYAEQFFG
nr:TcR V13J2.1 beta chain {clone Mouse3A5, complementarity determining region 3} [mice, CBA/J, induced autoimmune thyroiditic, thyroid, Peptide Partial, 15 aa] [Mus sp.]